MHTRNCSRLAYIPGWRGEVRCWLLGMHAGEETQKRNWGYHMNILHTHIQVRCIRWDIERGKSWKGMRRVDNILSQQSPSWNITINKAVHIGPPCLWIVLYPPVVGGAPLAALVRWHGEPSSMGDDVANHPRQVGDNMAPTSLNDGRGCQRSWSCSNWAWSAVWWVNGPVVVLRAKKESRQPKCRIEPERRNQTILGRGANRDFPLREPIPKAITLVMPRTSRAEEVRMVCVSNVIYHNVYLIRLINISGFLSN